MTNPPEKIDITNLARAKKQGEWICDFCMKCGDPECCQGKRTLYRERRKERAICNNCLRAYE